jgi:uncharacterized protein
MPEFQKGAVTIRENEPLDLSSAMLLECFPTIGLVSTIAASYLVTQLKLKLVGTITAPWLPPVAVVYDGKPLPPVRLYGGDKVCGIDGNCDQLFVMMSEFATPDLGVYPLADALLDWAHARGCREIVSLEGLAAETPALESGPERVALPKGHAKVWGVATTERTKLMLEREKVERMEAGVITGVSGVLLWLAAQRGVDTVCLLAEAFKEFPDARAAAELVRVVDALLKVIEVDLTPLMKQAEELESQIKRAVEGAMAAQQSRAVPQSAGVSPGMYY